MRSSDSAAAGSALCASGPQLAGRLSVVSTFKQIKPSFMAAASSAMLSTGLPMSGTQSAPVKSALVKLPSALIPSKKSAPGPKSTKEAGPLSPA